MSLHPEKLPLIHGLIDGELDAANAVATEEHLRACADCRAEMERIQSIRDILAATPLRDRAPEGLRTRIEAAIDAESEAAPTPGRLSVPEPAVPGRWAVAGGGIAAHIFDRRWLSGALVGMVAAWLVLAVALPKLTYTDTQNQLVQNHVRSLLAGHLVDVATSNRHVVKPWFNGRVDFAPPVPDLGDEGFPLAGGRLDYVDHQEVAAIVYRRRLHVINLFVRPARMLSVPVGIATRREGYSVVRWTAGGLEYWAVSDVDIHELELFQKLYKARAAA